MHAESANFSIMEKDSENCTTLKLLLHSVAEDSREEHEYICHDNLDTVAVSEVKRYVEKKYQIPECCQALYLESMALGDKDTLGKHKLRDGDSITVKYSTVANVKDINELVAILEQLLKQVELYANVLEVGRTLPPILRTLNLGMGPKKAREIVFNSFRDSSLKCDVNRLTFVHKGGAVTLYRLYGIISKLNSKYHIFQLLFLESVLIQVLGSALIDSCSRLPLLKKQVLTNPTLEYVLTSFTRVMILPGQKIVAQKGLTGEQVPAEVRNQVLAICLQMSQVNTSNLAEVEEYQLAIASNEKVIQQTLSLAVTPSFKFGPSLVAISTLDNLSGNEDAHVYLSSPQIINNVLSVYRNQQQRPYQSRAKFHLDSMILRSVMGTFFSELVCHSADIIPLPLKGKIYHFMENFLSNVDHREVRQHRDKYGVCCVDLLPTISLPYSPLDPVKSSYTGEHNLIMKKLKQLCVEFGVLCIQYELLGENERKSIIAKKLVDYVVCLPWHVTAGSRAHRRACDLVAFMSENMVLQPPSLINIARAKLAATHLGLKKTLKLSVHEIVTKLI